MDDEISTIEFVAKQLEQANEPSAALMKTAAARIASALEKMKITLRKNKSAPTPRAYTMTPQNFVDAFVVRAVYVWVPQAYWPNLVGMPPCPFCKSNVNVKILGWPSYGPRRVHGLEGGFFLIGQNLRCTRCKGEKGGQYANFMNYDARVMALYPRSVQAKFPCYVTHRCAMDVKLVALLVLCVLNKMNFAAMARIVNHMYRDFYLMREFLYLVTLHDVNAARAASIDRAALIGGSDPIGVQRFPSYDGLYDGFTVSAGYLKLLFVEDTARIAQWIQDQLGAVVGEYLVLDHTFTLAGKFRADGRGGKPYKALFGILNEDQQYTGVMVRDTMMETVRSFLESRNRANRDLGAKPVKYLSSDLCCCADKVLLDIFKNVDMVHLGGFHATRRICETFDNQHPSSGDACRAVVRAAMDYDGGDLKLHARVLQERARRAGRPLNDEDAAKEALADARGRCIRYYVAPMTMFVRMILNATSQ